MNGLVAILILVDVVSLGSAQFISTFGNEQWWNRNQYTPVNTTGQAAHRNQWPGQAIVFPSHQPTTQVWHQDHQRQEPKCPSCPSCQPYYTTKTVRGQPQFVTVTRDVTNYQTRTVYAPQYYRETHNSFATTTLYQTQYRTRTKTLYITRYNQQTVPVYITRTENIYRQRTETQKVYQYIFTTKNIPVYVTITKTSEVPVYVPTTRDVFKTETQNIPVYITRTQSQHYIKTVTVPVSYITQTVASYINTPSYVTVTVPSYIAKPCHSTVAGGFGGSNVRSVKGKSSDVVLFPDEI